MNNNDDLSSISIAVTSAANALDKAVYGDPFDITDIVAGSEALEVLVKRVLPIPVPSLHSLSIILMEIADCYPNSIPNTKTDEIIFSGYAARLRVLREFL